VIPGTYVFNTGSQTGNDGRAVVGTQVTGGYANNVILNSGNFVPQQ
jgi:hypothetical protein